jgi:hypothetical protein
MKQLFIAARRHSFPMTCSKRRFYDYRWPERTAELFHVGGNECGLDFDVNGPCKMESSGRVIDVGRCEVAAAAVTFLSVIANRMRFFEPPVGEPNSLQWCV